MHHFPFDLLRFSIFFNNAQQQYSLKHILDSKKLLGKFIHLVQELDFSRLTSDHGLISSEKTTNEETET